jgi:hypothetical protein
MYVHVGRHKGDCYRHLEGFFKEINTLYQGSFDHNVCAISINKTAVTIFLAEISIFCTMFWVKTLLTT